MKEKIGGELIRWNATRFGTVYLFLESFWDRKDKFKEWMVSKEWTDSEYRNDEMHFYTYDVLTSREWCDSLKVVLRILSPIYIVLRFADQQKNGTIGGFIPKVLHCIQELSEKKKAEIGLFQRAVDVVKKRLIYLCHDTLMMAATALDPASLYTTKLAQDRSSKLAVTRAFKKLAKSPKEAAAAIEQFTMFRTKRGLFGGMEARHSALAGRISAADWWGQYGGEFKELQMLAQRIVAQCMSSSGCESNWSAFALVHTKLRNRLSYDKLDKLVFVHYNLKLRLQQFEADMAPYQERDIDPCSVMIEAAMHDETNPILDWMEDSIGESSSQHDEVDHGGHDLDDSWSPTHEGTHLEGIEEFIGVKRKVSLDGTNAKKKEKVIVDEEDEEESFQDYDTESSNGDEVQQDASTIHKDKGFKFKDLKYNRPRPFTMLGDVDTSNVGAVSNVEENKNPTLKESTNIRPRSTRPKKPPPKLRSIDELGS